MPPVNGESAGERRLGVAAGQVHQTGISGMRGFGTDRNALTVTLTADPVIAVAGRRDCEEGGTGGRHCEGPLVPFTVPAAAVIVQGPPATVFKVPKVTPKPFVTVVPASVATWGSVVVNVTGPVKSLRSCRTGPRPGR